MPKEKKKLSEVPVRSKTKPLILTVEKFKANMIIK